jgi:hypothetical protein
MKWNLRWAAAKRDIWRPSDLLVAFKEVGFEPSLSKVAALWGRVGLHGRRADGSGTSGHRRGGPAAPRTSCRRHRGQ